MNDIPGIGFIPEKYRWLAVLLVVWAPLLTRAVFRRGGLKAMLSAFWLGTNTPAPKVTVTRSTGGGNVFLEKCYDPRNLTPPAPPQGQCPDCAARGPVTGGDGYIARINARPTGTVFRCKCGKEFKT